MAIRYAAQKEMNGAPPLDGALAVVVTATFPVPSSWSMRKRAAALAGSLPHIKTPDVDNLLKTIDESGNPLLAGGNQVTHATVVKQYGERPSLRIEILLRGQR